ncbi:MULTISPECIES: DUF2986 domain-containing protein [Vibrio]|uniref:DUF2986 domain-containing protein n=1 Tax=Vibrio casei TaxID=673372 RepID=A0A368LHH5_9VIBR|nr:MULTISPECIES: DUF2986 domain-containing protein [Vibrio]RCS70209.1 DUF2986 domain-containing protein [Vibrio casei]SJN25643.1 hypothetical protein FM109_06220 [Vibrio casei]HBV75984.1 DUF2986 domain-containing protein [Vibrio sp.]
MNRKKKINSILKKRLKQQNAKLHSTNKPKYISKADRAKMEEDLAQQASEVTKSDESIVQG